MLYIYRFRGVKIKIYNTCVHQNNLRRSLERNDMFHTLKPKPVRNKWPGSLLRAQKQLASPCGDMSCAHLELKIHLYGQLQKSWEPKASLRETNG